MNKDTSDKKIVSVRKVRQAARIVRSVYGAAKENACVPVEVVNGLYLAMLVMDEAGVAIREGR